MLLGNNKPLLRTVDGAWQRRLQVIPFTCRPPVRDEKLKERLRDEYPQILAWAIEGCRHWHQYGLQPPERVLEETASYFESQDTFLNWLENCCTLGKELAATNTDLFESWARYCDRHHEPAGSSRSFGDRLVTRGFRRFKNEFGIRGRGFHGLKVIPLSHLDGA